jgi:hypothetical protein
MVLGLERDSEQDQLVQNPAREVRGLKVDFHLA